MAAKKTQADEKVAKEPEPQAPDEQPEQQAEPYEAPEPDPAPTTFELQFPNATKDE